MKLRGLATASQSSLLSKDGTKHIGIRSKVARERGWNYSLPNRCTGPEI